ncbi:MAG: tetratricopeptide repeat protein [Acidimicrobiia bacterium]
MSSERRLAGVLVADVVGYSAAMGRDEAGTLAQLFEIQSGVVDPAIAAAGGRVVKTTGDGFLAEFPSVVGAVDAALAIQRVLADRPAVGAPMVMRMGLHLADVVVRDGDIFGDGVNLAARLEQAADPGGLLISESARQALVGDLADEFLSGGELRLKNIDRPVSVWRWTGATERPPEAPAVTERPKIAVLPFENLSGDPDQEHLASGVVEDLTTTLSRFHWFRVVARLSSEAAAAGAGHRDQIAGLLGADYVVVGSVRRAGDRIRIAAQLVDTRTSDHIWADRFDRSVGDLFELQDDIVRSIVGALVPGLLASFQPRRRTSVSSWEQAMRGWSLAFDQERATLGEAREAFEAALDDDASNTLALCGLAFVHSNPYYQVGVERDAEAALVWANRALDADDGDAFAWALAGIATFHSSDLPGAERLLTKALQRNPSLAIAHAYLARIASFRHDVDAAERWAANVVELSPSDPSVPLAILSRATARFGVGDYEAALASANEALRLVPSNPSGLRVKAASLEMLGRHDEAAAVIDRLLELDPVRMPWLRAELTPFEDPGVWETYLGALERAGVPAT